jgi:hypothetical protein
MPPFVSWFALRLLFPAVKDLSNFFQGEAREQQIDHVFGGMV